MPAYQQAEDQTKSHGSAYRPPGILSSVIIDRVSSPPGLGCKRTFGFGEAALRLLEMFLHAATYFGDLLSGLAGGGAQQFFCVGNNGVEIGDDLFLTELNSLVHDDYSIEMR